MNLLELDRIIDEYSKDFPTEKEASQKETTSSKKERVIENLKIASMRGNSGMDFYSQLELMEKKASSVAREILGLNPKTHGLPNVDEIVEIVFGGE